MRPHCLQAFPLSLYCSAVGWWYRPKPVSAYSGHWQISHADKADYAFAVASGVLAGLVDSLFVGEFSLEYANQWGNQQAEKLVLKVAKYQGYGGTYLGQAIKHLEYQFPIAADKATAAFGGGLQHHLRDFSHHPTPVGLVCSILTQFTGNVYGTDIWSFVNSDMQYSMINGCIYVLNVIS